MKHWDILAVSLCACDRVQVEVTRLRKDLPNLKWDATYFWISIKSQWRGLNHSDSDEDIYSLLQAYRLRWQPVQAWRSLAYLLCRSVGYIGMCLLSHMISYWRIWHHILLYHILNKVFSFHISHDIINENLWNHMCMISYVGTIIS